MEKPKVYDVPVSEAARRLDVCPETMRRWARTGVVEARKNMSGYWVFARDDLDNLPVREVWE